jgi:hypothetical protein
MSRRARRLDCFLGRSRRAGRRLATCNRPCRELSHLSECPPTDEGARIAAAQRSRRKTFRETTSEGVLWKKVPGRRQLRPSEMNAGSDQEPQRGLRQARRWTHGNTGMEAIPDARRRAAYARQDRWRGGACDLNRSLRTRQPFLTPCPEPMVSRALVMALASGDVWLKSWPALRHGRSCVVR